jgi:hypothetical protein
MCRLTMRYADASWHSPYGELGGREEALGYGHGDGTVSGGIEGEIVWANFPRRRQDGVWTPNVRGMIRTSDGNELVFAIHGQSVAEDAPGSRRAILARVDMATDAQPYRWLNTCFLVGEGEIDEERGEAWLDVDVCINEQAQGPPAIGAEPPERFRQGARTS